MFNTLRRSVAGLTLTFSLVLALQEVSVQPLPNKCSSFPSYNNSTGIAGPWKVVADSTGSAFDGFNVSAETFTNNGVDRFGFITLPKSPNRGNVSGQSVPLRCTTITTNNTGPSSPILLEPQLQAFVRSQWVDISIASLENWQSSFSFGMPDPGIQVQPYAHFVNGTRVPGIFLGTKGSTSWKYKFNWGGNAGEYYILRWLAKGSGGEDLRTRQDFPVIDDRDYVGFLKLDR
ncbi:hypothetical protein CC80DRAFT_281604 [Byssothecium circinans]|uniref:Ubiquitin 3 binding protein But2 C-terminal domain-containing protein n=1 Tax=Byssothecium circinans TaxID=147558 RepID=A0A6A5T8W7_9PLEO|nr:hypothetical protein CC80DRAFT_281604 [Byssothecium circinans]